MLQLAWGSLFSHISPVFAWIGGLPFAQAPPFVLLLVFLSIIVLAFTWPAPPPKE